MTTTDAPTKDPKSIEYISQLVDDPVVKWVMDWYTNNTPEQLLKNQAALLDASKIFWSLRDYYPSLSIGNRNSAQLIIVFTLLGAPPAIRLDGEFSFLGKTYKVAKTHHNPYNNINYPLEFKEILNDFMVQPRWTVVYNLRAYLCYASPWLTQNNINPVFNVFITATGIKRNIQGIAWSPIDTVQP
jgi:hypothetical protein